MSDPIYLDYNATTPVAPEVVEAMLPWLRDQFGNASSSHAFGKRAAAAVSHARDQVAAMIARAPRRDRLHRLRDRVEQPRHPRRRGRRDEASHRDQLLNDRSLRDERGRVTLHMNGDRG
jgi:hypothetical protein